MKILLISPKNWTTWDFRGDLIRDIIAKDYEVMMTGPDSTEVDKMEALHIVLDNLLCDGRIYHE